MKKLPLFFLFGLLAGCTNVKTYTTDNSAVTASSAIEPIVQAHIDSVQLQFAPDKRTALFQVKANGNVLVGETDMPEAKKALLDRLQATNIPFTDRIQMLPQADLEGMHHAVATISVANLRSQPKHSAELATQALLGTPLRVLKKEEGGWYLVQTPDKYLSWVDAGGIKLMDSLSYNSWQQSTKLIYTGLSGFAYAAPNAHGATVSDLVFGNILVLKNQAKGFYEVSLPDGRLAYVPVKDMENYKNWVASRNPTAENMVQSAQRMMGFPYLWGGTSPKGLDCSGFTKTIYFMHGMVLPRDASQQIHLGELVDTSKGFDSLQPGDLLFFGVPATDGKPERIVHVGMWIGGNQEFIHAAGKVRVNSLNASAPNFDAFELNRFLRAKRIAPEATLFELKKQALYE